MPEDSADPDGPHRLALWNVANLAGEWQLDAEPPLDGEFEEVGAEVAAQSEPAPVPPPDLRSNPFPSTVPIAETPPPTERIVEAMLFAGGLPLTAERAGEAVRGLTGDVFRSALEFLNRKYRSQNRPYSIVPRDGGYILAIRPAFRGVRERIFGGPRETRLTQPALDVLSLVAYRQPIAKVDVDALRGADSAGILRQLVRLGLVAVTRRAVGETPSGYGTTARFLELFGLSAIEDLPRLGDSVQMGG